MGSLHYNCIQITIIFFLNPKHILKSETNKQTKSLSMKSWFNHFILFPSSWEGQDLFHQWVYKYWLIDLNFFFFFFWNRDTARSLISSYPNISKYSLSAVGPVWSALPNTIAVEVEREIVCRCGRSVFAGRKKSLLALKQICLLWVNTLRMSEETFSVEMGRVSALCVNNLSEVCRNQALFCSKWHRLHFSRCR